MAPCAATKIMAAWLPGVPGKSITPRSRPLLSTPLIQPITYCTSEDIDLPIAWGTTLISDCTEPAAQIRSRVLMMPSTSCT